MPSDLPSEDNGIWVAEWVCFGDFPNLKISGNTEEAMEKTKTVVKTVKQYNKYPIPPEDMDRLMEIAQKYGIVRNYVYKRYGGINSIDKITPGYTIGKEMNNSGFRQQIGIPVIYYERAIYDALTDIRAQWSVVKNKIRTLAINNPQFTDEDRHYIFFVLKYDKCFQAVTQRSDESFAKEAGKAYEKITANIDKHRLDNYINRQIRKKLNTIHTNSDMYFKVKSKMYNYTGNSIRIPSVIPRKFICVPLTDSNRYSCQICIKLIPEENGFEITVPIEVKVREHDDYTNSIGVAFGMFEMLTTSTGNIYGADFRNYMNEFSEWRYKREKNRPQNVSRKKFDNQIHKYEERLHSYINNQINLMLENEKPEIIYIPKYPRLRAKGINKIVNNNVSSWQRGYIRNRIIQKCSENCIQVIEVASKDIGVRCSSCGDIGDKCRDIYTCPKCGYTENNKINTAKNVYLNGINGVIKY